MSWNLGTWINDRFPLKTTWDQHFAEYYAPKNFNFWYFFGVFSLLVLVNQMVTGLWLTMYYVPTDTAAFDSVEHIMRNVSFGWMIRYMHTTGASAFFIVIYCHIHRALLYGSYKKPRELVWLLGMLLYILIMSEGFSGYILPWGQMSFWAAKVVSSLFASVPWVGDQLTLWFKGDYTVSGVTLHRFFSLHVIALPILLLIGTFLHIVALHKVGSNNPDGIEIKANLNKKGKPKDGIPFHPYYTVKDLFGATIFIMIFCSVMFFIPDFFGLFLEPDNFIPANRLVTPEHIKPVWYFSPFYAMLRAVPSKLGGMLLMGGAIAVFLFLPWLDRSPVKSIRYKGCYSKIALSLFVVSFFVLMFVGLQPVNSFYLWMARLFTIVYFGFFIAMPYYTSKEKILTPPNRVTYR